MAYSFQPLVLTIISAKDLNVVTLLSKMDVYAVATLSGDPRTKQRTPTDENGHKNPTWNAHLRFSIPDNVDRSTVSIIIQISADRALGDRNIGEVHIPLKELEADTKSFKSTQFVSYQVRKPDGKPKGILNISYKFGERVSASPPPPVAYPPQESSGQRHGDHAAAYPPPGTSAQPYPPPVGYLTPAASGSSSYPPPPPPAGYPPPHAGAYNYPGYPTPHAAYPPSAGYPYGAPPPVVQTAQKPQKSKFGLGLGAGLLGGAIGGMLIGDAIGDAADEAAAYDAGYDAGLEDAGGFDGGFDF